MKFDKSLRVVDGQFIAQKQNKLSIFIHHLAGTTKGSVNWWNQTKDRVATQIIISRDGTIHECFPLEYWAYHLGVEGDDNFHEKHSVNIELESYGGLVQHNGLWKAKVSSTSYRDIPQDEVYVLDNEWRGYKAFHAYTKEQCQAVKELLEWLWLDSDFEDLRPQRKLGKWWEYDKTVLTERKAGVYSHTTVRKDKSDIYPDKNLLAAVSAAYNKANSVLRNSPNKTGK